MKHLARRVVRRKRKIETTKELHRVED
jgi:hypothetical protein